jgi:hypothetical protein
LLIKGHPLDYDGTRSSKEILKWVKEIRGETLDDLPTVGDIGDYLEESEVSIIFFVESLHEKNLNIFNAVSKMYPHFAFGFTSSA